MKTHLVIKTIINHRGDILVCVPLVDSIMYVKAVKSDLLYVLNRDPHKCDEISLNLVNGCLYVDRKN